MRNQMAVCLLVMWVVAESGLLGACDCAPPPPPKEAMEWSGAVFLAEVARVENDTEGRMVTLEVKRWWKGGDSAEVVVSTAKDGRSCGYDFLKGKRYLIYADALEKNRPLHVTLCSRTSTLKEAETNGDFKELGEGKPPSPK